jgi:glycosyltransferase involved in cell wall biosynthesis
MRQRPQYLLEAFARAGHDVYFVDPREPDSRVADGVHVVPSLKFVPRSHVILYVHFTLVYAMFDRFENPVIVYDILDDLSIYDDDEAGLPEQRRVRARHPAVMERADVVTASAPALVSAHLSERSDILLVENGVDPDRFGGEHHVPDALSSLEGPIIGYHGAVARWFDFDLFAGVAEALPSFRFVFVGPVDPGVQARFEDVVALPNVFSFDAVHSDEIADYVASFDVGIIPFVVDSLTAAVSPLKMYEFLAAGVPVVATPLPVSADHPLVRTASDTDGFASQIVGALSDRRGSDFARDAAAAAVEASWKNRVEQIRSTLREHGKLRVPL